MAKVITFGEMLLRLSTPSYATIDQSQSFLVNYGGAEANVAVSLSHLGHKNYFLTKLPDNQIADGAISFLRKNGVCVDHVVKGSTTIGIYFLETGFGGRPSKVIYNRKHSAFTRVDESEFDWDQIFKDANWFHVSGITLALGENVRKAVFKALEVAKRNGLKISFDFNYRKTLWTEQEAKKVYFEFMKYVDVLFCSYWDANSLLEIPLCNELKDASFEVKRKDVFFKLLKKYNLDYIFGTDRKVYSASENGLSAYYYQIDKQTNKLITNATPLVDFKVYDRIGGGDAFAAGIIHGLLKNYNNPNYAIEFGLSNSVLKHTIYGDSASFNVDDVENFMNHSSLEVNR